MLEGIRWLIVDSDHRAAAAIARELSLLGCRARLVDAVGLDLGQLSGYDAHVVLVDEAQDIRFLHERMELHAGLRYAGVLRLPFVELWPVGAHTPNLGILADKVRSLIEPDAALRTLASGGDPQFEAHAEALGVVRCLRAIAAASDVFRVSLRSKKVQAHIELAGHLVLGAWYESPGTPALMGEEALASAIELTDTDMTVRRKVRPETPWLVVPLDEALERALLLVRERRMLAHDDSPTLRLASPLLQAEQPEAEDADTDADQDIPVARAVPTLSIPAPSRRYTPFSLVTALALLVGIGILVHGVRRRFELVRPTAALTKAPQPTGARVGRAGVAAPVTKQTTPAPRLFPDDKEAIPLQTQPSAPESSDARALATQASKALASGDWKNAQKWAERAVQLRPRKFQYRMLLARVLAASGQRDQALIVYRSALAQRPQSRTIQQRIARLQKKGAQPEAGEW